MIDLADRSSAVAPSRRQRGADSLLGAIVVGAAFATWWPIVVAMRSAQPIQLAVIVAHATGMLGAYLIVVLLALMSRAPTLERSVGADVLARWHARGGRIVVMLVLLHAWAAVAAWAQSRRQTALVSVWHVVRLPWLPATSIGTALLAAVGVVSIRAARRRLSYETWHAVHLLTYLVVALTFVHELAGPDFVGRRWLQIGWALLHTSVLALIVRHRFLTPLRQAARHRLRVVDVVAEGPEIVSIVVEGDHLRELQSQPGQFFRWRFLTPDTWRTAHPFSLSAPPTDSRLRLSVKVLGQGSSHLQSVAMGTWVIAEGPYGAMTARRRTRHDVALIAGGIGITPMRALFETLPLCAGQDLVLLYRARSAGEVIFRAELDEIAHRRGARVLYLFGADRSCLTAAGLIHLVPNLAWRDVYLCASHGMSQAVRASLQQIGHPPEWLHEERFAF